MDDRELLELAAKAAGFHPYIALYGWNEFGGGINLERTTPFDPDVENWNPLTDDGDALRLAVKTCIGFIVDDEWVNVYRCKHHGPLIDLCELYKNHDGDKHAATRRAIVRAAAAIGQEMK